MASEKTALLSGGGKGARADYAAGRGGAARRSSRFGDGAPSKGVRPNRQSMSGVPSSLASAPRRRASTAAQGDKKKAEAMAFSQNKDGVISGLTPLEMGRQELYEEIPFIAVPGLQKKEHNLSIAFSSYAAFLDNEETDAFLKSTTGVGLNDEEKEKRASRMSMMMLDELQGPGAATLTMPLAFAVLIASFLQFNYGYNIGIMNPAEPYAYPGHSVTMWSVAVSTFCAGGPFGAVLGGKWADEKGRKGGMLIVAWLFIIGGLLQTLAPNVYVAAVARAIIGVASGATSVIVPIYLGEVAPPNLRGVMGTMTQFACVIGIFMADVAGFPFGSEGRWRYMFLGVTVLAAFPVVLKPFLLESPRWLLGRDPDSSEARFVIKTFRGFRYDEEVETEVEHLVNASKKQSLKDDDAPKSGGKSPVAELFSDKNVRLLLVSSLILQAAQQLSGINAVFFYSGLFFDGVIENPLVGTTLMAGINVLATYVALLLMDRCGRRTLILWSSGGMFLSCILLTLALLGYFSKLMALGAVALYVTFFELGLGPIPFLIVAEMFDAKYIAMAMSVSQQLNYSCNFLVGLFFPTINAALGPYCFGPFAVVLLIAFVYTVIWLPETAGTTPEELQAALIKKNEKTTYHNMDIEGMAGHLPQPRDEWASALESLEAEKGLV